MFSCVLCQRSDFMAMTILNNSSTALSLGELNKNINKLGKTLTKVSTGQRIVRASDDAASFAISEKMREQIRSLEQDIQNVQNGSAMLRTAHGGIENIVDELRSLKELAINAANDSNTDEDRAIIQKEFDKRRDTIDDIATWTTYNTKPLLDGTYSNTAYKYILGSSGLADAFSPGSPNCKQVYVTETGYGHGIIPVISFMGTGEIWKNSPLTRATWINDDENNEDGLADIAVRMNFSTVGEGFAILCGGCSQYINIKFDNTIDPSSSFRSRNPAESSDDDSIENDLTIPIEYTIGTAGVTGKDLSKTLFESVKSMNSEEYVASAPNGVEIVMLDINHGVSLLQMNGEYYMTKEASPPLCIYNGLITEGDASSSYKEALTIHHGTRSNQATNFFINDMHSNALGINTAEVTIRSKATSAIGIIDEAIVYALHEATNVGAYLQRLDYTEANVTAQDESTQNAESTIRDADMAKEMTEYTKQNVLTQAAQSMLAQANQNLSGVLSLLQ